MKAKGLHRYASIFGFILFAAALWALSRELRHYHYRDAADAVRNIPFLAILASIAVTVLNYSVMTGYDALAFRFIRHSLPYRRIAFASFIGYAFSNNVGFSMLAGSSVRYRIYSAWGLSALEITQVVAFYTVSLWLGLFMTAGISFLADPAAIPAALHIPFASVRPVGVCFLGIVAAYALIMAGRRRDITFLRWHFALPSPKLSLAQVVVASLDWLLAGAALFVLLPSATGISLPAFLSVYLLAQLIGLVSQVPGGLGVFETAVVLLLAPKVPASALLGPLIAYRGIYYLLPFVTAVAMLGAFELLARKERFAQAGKALAASLPSMAPRFFSFMTYVAGAILLFSGATPSVRTRIAALRDIIPLPVLELSHFLGSLMGAALLILARGLQRRLDGAYHLASLVLAAGAVMSLLKGFDYEEAFILIIMLFALRASHRSFYRTSSLLSERFTLRWTIAVVAILIGSVWLGLFSYKHVEYSHDLWWQFSFFGDAPRFLRSTAGAAAMVVIFGIARLLRPVPPEPSVPAPVDMGRARDVIGRSRTTSANLALLGDKRLLFSASGNAFIMYGIEGRSWVSMGDPVGDADEHAELVWQFLGLCDRHGGWPAFYETSRETLPLFIDAGLTGMKIGEEARVPLDAFSLEGSGRKGLRYAHHRHEREGSAFEVIPPQEVPAHLPELRAISDAWLADKHAREKRFSLGYFSEAYLREFSVAIVRHGGVIIGFANIWRGSGREELSIDLMRHLPSAPHGVMEYLFTSLMFWGKSEGYRWFNLGMVPLAGLEDRIPSSLWTRLGSVLYRHGEHFYNFQGLRHYKEQFDPVWEPRYLVTAGGLVLPRVIANIASLISGGITGVIIK